MAKYSYITDKTNNNRKVQVESAVRDGEGKNIVNNYAKQNGYYENMGVGQADNLSTDRQIDNPETACPPIVMGITGGEAEIKSGIENFDYLEGKSIAFNQKAQLNRADGGGYGISWTTSNNVISISGTATADLWITICDQNITDMVAGHKYLLCGNKQTTTAGKGNMYYNDNNSPQNDNGAGIIFTCAVSAPVKNITVYIQNGTAISGSLKYCPQLFDLTLIYGAGNEPTTVADFKKDFPLDYYAYNAGSILSAKTNALISRGRQQWDEETELGNISTSDGSKVSQNNCLRSANYIPVIGNQAYYIKTPNACRLFYYDANKNFISYKDWTGNDTFTTPSNCSYLMFRIADAYGTTYKHDITISIYFEDGEGYSEYYPYSQDSVELPNIELRAIGNIKDIAYASGGGKRRVGKVVLDENSTWIFGELAGSGRVNYNISDMVDVGQVRSIGHFRASNFNSNTNAVAGDCFAYEQRILFYVPSGITTEQQWLTWVANNPITVIYELATETELTENTGWDNTINVDNYGTLEFTTDPQQVPQVEQPYFIKYTVNLGEWIDSAYVRTSGDADSIALLEDVQELQDKLEDGDIVVAKSKLSDNLDTNVVQNDIDAYTFRTAGGSLEIGETCKVKEIVGGTVAFNQKVEVFNSTFTMAQITYTCNTTNGTVKCVGTSNSRANGQVAYTRTANANDKLLIGGTLSSFSVSTSYYAVLFQTSASAYISHVSVAADTVKSCPSGTQQITLEVVAAQSSGQTVDFTCKPQIFNLTQMFGSTIADYIYSLEQANTGAGVAWFKRYFPNTYYAYNAGTLVNVQTSGKKYVGFNQFNDTLEGNGIDISTGQNASSPNAFRSANYTKVLTNTVYCLHTNSNLAITSFGIYEYDDDKNYIKYTEKYANDSTFTLSSETHYVRLAFWKSGSSWASNVPSKETVQVNLNFHYDGERDGEYEPYESNEYALSPVELRGIAKKDAQGNLYFDGDSYTPDGNVVRKYKVITITADNIGNSVGTSQGTSLHFVRTNITAPDVKDGLTWYEVIGIASNGYIVKNASSYWGVDLSICVNKDENATNGITIFNNALSTVDQFKALCPITLIYPIEDEEETTDTYQETQQVDNWGTEQYLPPETDTRPCEIPVGHNTDYLLDIRSKVEIMPDSPTDDGVYVVQTSSGTNEYIPLGTWLTNNDYKQSKDLPTKDALGGTLRQLLAISKNIDFDNTAWVDLGELNWGYSDTAGHQHFYYNSLSPTAKPNTGSGDIPNAICSAYRTGTPNNVYGHTYDKTMTITTGGNLNIYDSNYTNATAFKNAMKGVLLAYEKA